MYEEALENIEGCSTLSSLMAESVTPLGNSGFWLLPEDQSRCLSSPSLLSDPCATRYSGAMWTSFRNGENSEAVPKGEGELLWRAGSQHGKKPNRLPAF